jgi:hypothetical protein
MRQSTGEPAGRKMSESRQKFVATWSDRIGQDAAEAFYRSQVSCMVVGLFALPTFGIAVGGAAINNFPLQICSYVVASIAGLLVILALAALHKAAKLMSLVLEVNVTIATLPPRSDAAFDRWKARRRTVGLRSELRS